MMVYYFILGLPATLSVLSHRQRIGPYGLICFGTVLAVCAGFRDHVGMDWNNYLATHWRMATQDLSVSVAGTEPASRALFWISENHASGIYTTNLVAAIILALGLVLLARTTADPWLSLVAAIPYLFIVIGMSATRQSIAVGLFLITVARWNTSGLVFKIVLILAASMFHSSALSLLAFVVVGSRLDALKKTLMTALTVAVGVHFASTSSLFADQLEFYVDSYFSAGENNEVISPGALFHVSLVALPAAIYLLQANSRQTYDELLPILRYGAYLSIALLPLSFFYSSAASRFSIYLYFVPMMAYPIALRRCVSLEGTIAMKVSIVLFHFLLLWVWLNYGNNSAAYLPYTSTLF